MTTGSPDRAAGERDRAADQEEIDEQVRASGWPATQEWRVRILAR